MINVLKECSKIKTCTHFIKEKKQATVLHEQTRNEHEQLKIDTLIATL